MGTRQSRFSRPSTQPEGKKTAPHNGYLAKFLGPEKAGLLQKKYLTDLTRKIDRLRVHMEAEDMSEIRRIAHQLKGSGKSYGFEYVSEIGKAMGSCAGRKDYSGLTHLIRNLEAAVRNLISKAESHGATHGSEDP